MTEKIRTFMHYKDQHEVVQIIKYNGKNAEQVHKFCNAHSIKISDTENKEDSGRLFIFLTDSGKSDHIIKKDTYFVKKTRNGGTFYTLDDIELNSFYETFIEIDIYEDDPDLYKPMAPMQKEKIRYFQKQDDATQTRAILKFNGDNSTQIKEFCDAEEVEL